MTFEQTTPPLLVGTQIIRRWECIPQHISQKIEQRTSRRTWHQPAGNSLHFARLPSRSAISLYGGDNGVKRAVSLRTNVCGCHGALVWLRTSLNPEPVLSPWNRIAQQTLLGPPVIMSSVAHAFRFSSMALAVLLSGRSAN